MRLPGAGRVARLAADIAEEYVGVSEEGNNRGIKIAMFHRATTPVLTAGDPYCAAFVVYCLRSAAHRLGINIPLDWPRSGYTPDHARWAKKKGVWIYREQVSQETAQRGDLVCFYFRHHGRIAHMGIVTGWDEEHDCLTTVEGNTGPGGAIGAVDRDGEGVYAKRRPLKSLGQYGGLVRLEWG